MSATLCLGLMPGEALGEGWNYFPAAFFARKELAEGRCCRRNLSDFTPFMERQQIYICLVTEGNTFAKKMQVGFRSVCL